MFCAEFNIAFFIYIGILPVVMGNIENSKNQYSIHEIIEVIE